MRLNEIAAGAAPPVPIIEVALHHDLVKDMQDRLAELGILDPPSDGLFGPVSRWALDTFLSRTGMSSKIAMDRESAVRLLEATAESLYPVHAAEDFPGRIIAAMIRNTQWFCRVPGAVNIVYVEGVRVDGTRNGNAPNQFNDVRSVILINAAGRPEFPGMWDGTTEPSRFWTEHPMNPNGAARIAFGQYKSWSLGTHGSGESAHEALVQTAPIRVHRDLNRDFRRANDMVEQGLFAINQHWGYDMPESEIGKASAGCLVGRTRSGHRAFMKIVKSDPRFKASSGYRFLTTVLDGASV